MKYQFSCKMKTFHLRKAFFIVIFFIYLFSFSIFAEEKITIAAASDLKFALEEIIQSFKKKNQNVVIDTIYGSSGKFRTQIEQGAPYDLYFSADISYPRALKKNGFSSSDVQAYALGRIVLWSATLDAQKMKLENLLDPSIKKIAIANPKHAPYGMRAEEALRSSGVWENVQKKIILGDNIAHTAQFVQTGNADIGIIALSLAKNPELAVKGKYSLIPETLHKPLEQGFIVTKRAAKNPLAFQFATYIQSKEAIAVLQRYGFVMPQAGKKM